MFSNINKLTNNSLKGLYKEFYANFNKLKPALESYLENYENTFVGEKDYFHIRGGDNIFKCLPLNRAGLRVTPLVYAKLQKFIIR